MRLCIRQKSLSTLYINHNYIVYRLDIIDHTFFINRSIDEYGHGKEIEAVDKLLKNVKVIFILNKQCW